MATIEARMVKLETDPLRKLRHAIVTGHGTDKGGGLYAAGALPAPVLPGESETAWQEHLAGTLESLQPFGHLEAVLAERIALLTWQQARLAAHQHAGVQRGLSTIEQDYRARGRFDGGPLPREHPDDLQWQAEEAVALEALCTRLLDLPEAEPVPNESVQALWYALTDAAGMGEDDDVTVPDVPDQDAGETVDDWLGRVAWTAGLVRGMVDAVSHFADQESDRFLASIRHRTMLKNLEAQQAWAAWQAELARMRHERTLPDATRFVITSRQEAHIQAQLHAALAELAALQVRRWMRLLATAEP